MPTEDDFANNTPTVTQTIGISPKVKIPAGVLFVIGVALILLGAVSGEDSLKEAGALTIAASGVNLGAGFLAGPGVVYDPDTDEPLD